MQIPCSKAKCALADWLALFALGDEVSVRDGQMHTKDMIDRADGSLPVKKC